MALPLRHFEKIDGLHSSLIRMGDFARLGEAIQTPPPPQRHTLFDAAVDALADFLANVCERPATAIALVAIGMLSVIVPAICWGVLR
jgi:hypothetical protein